MAKRIALCGLLIILASTQVAMAEGQEIGVSAPNPFRFGVNARALAMGGAFVALADDYSATYWNPAGMPQIETVDVGFMNTNKFGQGIQLNFASAVGSFHLNLARSLPSLHGAGGVGWLSESIGDIEAFGPGGEATGTVSSGNSLLIGAFSAGVEVGLLSLYAGGSLDWYRHSLAAESGSGLGSSFGIIADFSDALAIGYLSTEPDDLVIEWTTGAVDEMDFGKSRVGIAVRILHDALTVALQRDLKHGLSRLGVEFLPLRAFNLAKFPLAVRLGGKIPDQGSFSLTTGLGLAFWEQVQLDIALVTNRLLGNSLVVSANISF